MDSRPGVYPGKLSAAVLGRSGKPEVELNLDAVRADGLTVYKRQGGGCAVLLDPGNIIVSVVLPLPGLGKLRAAFGAISDWLIEALAETGIPDIKQKGCSDLALGDRKIGGSCIYRARDLLYYTTTLLVDPDLDLVERYIAHPPREPDYREGRDHRAFMGRLSDTKNAHDPEQLATRLRGLLDPEEIQL